MQKLPVIFRANKSGQFKGDITAILPTIPADCNGRYMTCYAHVGQHGNASFDWYRGTRPARPDEFASLLRELTGIYTDSPSARPDIYGAPVQLEICQRISPKHTQAMRAELDAIYKTESSL